MITWFTVKVKYTKQLEDGRLKRVTEPYVVDSVSFTDAEARIYEEVGQYVKGEFIIKGISRVDYADVFYYDDSEDWYKCKMTYLSVDADEGKEKKINSNLLVTANSVREAFERIKESLSDMTVSFDLPSIMLTNIVDVIPYDPEAKTGQEKVISYQDSSETDEEEEQEDQTQEQEETTDLDSTSNESDDELSHEGDEVNEDDVTLEDKTEQ